MWIKTSEQLPPKDRPFLACVVGIYKDESSVALLIADTYEIGWYSYDGSCDGCRVFTVKDHCTNSDCDCSEEYITHWMPLPELPKE